MTRPRSRSWRLLLVVATIAILVAAAAPAPAVEVGQPAPEFRLPATTGVDITLSEFRGKKWVLLEFYGLDFAPT